MKRFLCSLCLIALIAANNQGARLFDGVNDSLRTSSTVDLSAVSKITIVFWLWWDAYGTDSHQCMELTADQGLTTNGFVLIPNGSTGVWLVAFTGNVGGVVATFTRPSAAAWHHFTILLDKSKSTQEVDAVYVDGSSQSLTFTANANNTNNWANSNLNFMSRNNASLWGAGRMAEAAIYPGVLLGATEASALAGGASPSLVRPSIKPFYWPLIGRGSPEPELRYGKTATVNGAVQTPHVRVYYPFNSMNN